MLRNGRKVFVIEMKGVEGNKFNWGLLRMDDCDHIEFYYKDDKKGRALYKCINCGRITYLTK